MDEARIPAEAQPDDQRRSEDRTISLLRANIVMLYAAVPAVLLPLLLWQVIWGLDKVVTLVTGDVAGYVLLVAVLLGVLVHEALHALAWMRAAKLPWSLMRFGFDWKTVTPYAHCTVPIQARAYRIGAATPLLVLGVLPLIVSLIAGWVALFAFGLFFTFAAGGDMLILWLIRDVPAETLVSDHPTQAGCVVHFDSSAGIATEAEH